VAVVVAASFVVFIVIVFVVVVFIFIAVFVVVAVVVSVMVVVTTVVVGVVIQGRRNRGPQVLASALFSVAKCPFFSVKKFH
jgi:hypothetical protein